jgi:hypothetical protein
VRFSQAHLPIACNKVGKLATVHCYGAQEVLRLEEHMAKYQVLVTSLLIIISVLGGCATGVSSTSVLSGNSGASCTPTDQNQYVYHPDRLQVVQLCLHVSGIVDAVRDEADGDKHILLHLDPQYQQFLRPANQNEQGDLVVEPICVGQVSQQDAVGSCASDPDPYAAPLPAVGDHVWMEGRYVYDLDHGGWAELHPLYRSGTVSS